MSPNPIRRPLPCLLIQSFFYEQGFNFFNTLKVFTKLVCNTLSVNEISGELKCLIVKKKIFLAQDQEPDVLKSRVQM